MNSDLKVALIQTDLVWENPSENRRLLNKKIDALSTTADLIVLPEMFTSGFTMNPEAVAEPMTGKTIVWLKEKANEQQAVILGSLVIAEHNNYYNRMVVVKPSGQIITYDKRHTFTLAGEHKVYTAGNEKVVFEYKGWKICPLVCYDLRFPVWARNAENYDLLIYVANWPKIRIEAWDALLKARAIENMTYCIGVNRVGRDGNNFEYSGHSAAYNVLGQRIDHLSENEDATELVSLDKEAVNRYREKLNFLNDRDDFSLRT
ncbi:amidohydrolase [Winogradskyella eckloniae]|uniref:amidohydrolase n=1 Tax=Winogradskyella eckloniae TaxID=1089306 RepID=UPI00156575D3|nr:amidohydrolase [Winogradskyella eckloniae]NRD19132.1 amidohydrolase [Winogradskyella eckloniae]